MPAEYHLLKSLNRTISRVRHDGLSPAGLTAVNETVRTGFGDRVPWSLQNEIILGMRGQIRQLTTEPRIPGATAVIAQALKTVLEGEVYPSQVALLPEQIAGKSEVNEIYSAFLTVPLLTEIRDILRHPEDRRAKELAHAVNDIELSDEFVTLVGNATTEEQKNPEYFRGMVLEIFRNAFFLAPKPPIGRRLV